MLSKNSVRGEGVRDSAERTTTCSVKGERGLWSWSGIELITETRRSKGYGLYTLCLVTRDSIPPFKARSTEPY